VWLAIHIVRWTGLALQQKKKPQVTSGLRLSFQSLPMHEHTVLYVQTTCYRCSCKGWGKVDTVVSDGPTAPVKSVWTIAVRYLAEESQSTWREICPNSTASEANPT
jgi:hypothetical protein